MPPCFNFMADFDEKNVKLYSVGCLEEPMCLYHFPSVLPVERERDGIVFLKSLVGSLRVSRLGSPPQEASHPFTHVPPLPPWLTLRAAVCTS